MPLLEYLIIFILSGGAGLQSTGSNVIKMNSKPNFSERFGNFRKNSRKRSLMEFFFNKVQAWNIPEISVSFFTEAHALADSPQNSSS